MTIKRAIIIVVILVSLSASYKIVAKHIDNKNSHEFLNDYAILVIESDGWDIDWNTKDSVENSVQKENLKNLFAILEKHEDANGKRAVIQANFSDSFFLHGNYSRKDSSIAEIFRNALNSFLITPELFLESDGISIVLLEEIDEGFSAIFGYEPISISIKNLQFSQQLLNKLNGRGIIIMQNYSAMSTGDGAKPKLERKLRNFFHSNGSPVWENRQIMGLNRSVRFEPLYEADNFSRERVVKEIEQIWKNNGFVILSTHRSNFTQSDSTRSNFALSELDSMLQEVATIAQNQNKKLLFMDNRELARVVVNQRVE